MEETNTEIITEDYDEVMGYKDVPIWNMVKIVGVIVLIILEIVIVAIMLL